MTRNLRGFIYPRNVVLYLHALSEDGSLFAATSFLQGGKQALIIYFQQDKFIHKYTEIVNDIKIEYGNFLTEFEISKNSEQHYFLMLSKPSCYFAIYDIDVTTQTITLITQKINNTAVNYLHNGILFELWRIGWLKVTNFQCNPVQKEIMLVDVQSFNVYKQNNILKLRTQFQNNESLYLLPQLDQVYKNKISKSSKFLLKQDYTEVGVCQKLSLNQIILLSFKSQNLILSNQVQRNQSIKMINGKVTYIGSKDKLLRALGKGDFDQLNMKYAIQRNIKSQLLHNIYEIQTAQKISAPKNLETIYLGKGFIMQKSKYKFIIYQLMCK